MQVFEEDQLFIELSKEEEANVQGGAFFLAPLLVKGAAKAMLWWHTSGTLTLSQAAASGIGVRAGHFLAEQIGRMRR